MKVGMPLTELAAELHRQAESKRDYLADTRAIRLEPTPGESAPVIMHGVNGGLALRPTAHAQLAAAVGIPKPYYDRMLADAPDLLAANVNRWLTAQPVRKLVRTLDGAARAILSDSYRPLDNFDLAEAVLPTLVGVEAEVVSCDVTDARFYLKAVTKRVEGEVKPGDVIRAGLVVSNSEIGHGALRVEALDYRLVCTNGMIREAAVRKAHLGRSGTRGTDAIEDAREYFRDETRAADDRAFFLKVADAVRSMFDPVRFAARLDQYRDASARRIEVDPIRVVDATAKRLALTDGEKTSVLQHLIRGGDLSAWGLANAVTRTADDAADYDRATELEAAGGRVIELGPADWKSLAA
jgi:hypothetical protein